MKSELQSISRLFTETLFRIPDYQRGYAWTEKQLRDFWNDIEQLEPGKKHYTGVLTVEEVPRKDYERWDDDTWIIESKRYQPLYVVDGQQRLTTAMILIQVILEKLPDTAVLNYTNKEEIRRKFIFESKDGGISRSYLFGYEKDNPSYEFLKQSIFVEPSDSHSVDESTIYTKNLADAKEYFRAKIAALDLSELERTYEKVTQALLFNSYVITEDIDVFVAFETMNNRGKPLSVLELLKNRLIYLSTKVPNSEERGKLRATINECWKSAYHFLGRNDEAEVDDDLFLKRHYVLYFGAKEPAATATTDDEQIGTESFRVLRRDYDKFLLEDHFVVKNVREPIGHPRLTVNALYEYAHSIKLYVRFHDQITNPLDSSLSKDEKRVLSQIVRIAGGAHGDDFNMLLLAIYTSPEKISSANRVKALRLIENILFVASIGWWRIDELKMFDAQVFAIRLAARRLSFGEVLRALGAYVDERNSKADPHKLIAWWAQKPLGFYNWRCISYFMFEYEQKLRESSKNEREKLHWKEFASDGRGRDFATVEHILPQQVSNEYWKSMVKGYSLAQRNMLKHTLGNLLPLSQPKNAALSNRSFPEKRGTTGSTVGYAYGCYSEIEVAQQAEWTARDILERSVRLLTFLEERWGLAIGSRKDKISVLGLEFVK